MRPGTNAFSPAPLVLRRTATGQSRPVPRQLRRNLSLAIGEGMAGEALVACAGGGVLTGWALYLHCSPLVIALIGALPFLAQGLQLPSAWLTSWLGSRRVAIAGMGAARLVILPLIVLPFLALDEGWKRTILVGVAAASSLLAVIGNNAWVAWMGDLVPESLRGRYFGKRLAFATFAGALGALTAGLALDVARRHGVEKEALSALAAAGSVAALVSVFFMARQGDALVPRPRTARFDLRAMIAPLRDPGARPFLRYQLSWNAAIGVSAAFYAVFMLQNLKMGFALMALHSTAAAMVRVLVSPLWGRIIDRVGARPVLIVCSFGLPVVPLLWLFPTADSLLVPLVLDVVLAGALWGGHNLAAFELPLSVAPKGSRPYYVAAFAAAGGLAFAAASFVGGALAQSLPDTVHVFGQPLQNLQVLFAISAAGRLLSAPLALRIREPGSSSTRNLWAVAFERLQLGRGLVARAAAYARR